MKIFVILPIVLGFFFLVIAAVGAVRLPDFYTRSHAIAVTDTLGTLLILGGLALNFGFQFTTAKLILVILFIYIANPAITHILVRAALRAGLKPWTVKKP
jgi:multicomponent Na+:H+ antiporter subunit G